MSRKMENWQHLAQNSSLRKVSITSSCIGGVFWKMVEKTATLRILKKNEKVELRKLDS